jgi:hypothetical protein
MKCLDKKVEFSFRTDAGGVVLLTVEPDGTFQTERVQATKENNEPRTLSTETLPGEDMSLVPCCRDFYLPHFAFDRGKIQLRNPIRFYAPLDFPGAIDVTGLLGAVAVDAEIDKGKIVIITFKAEISPALVQILQWVESGSLGTHYFTFFITLLINAAIGTYSWIPGQDVQPQNIFTPEYVGLTEDPPVMKLVVSDPSMNVEMVDKESFHIECLGVTAVY